MKYTDTQFKKITVVCVKWNWQQGRIAGHYQTVQEAVDGVDPWFSTWTNFAPPTGDLAVSGGISSCLSWEEQALLAFGEWRQGTCSVFECIGETPQQKNYPTQTVNSTEIEKPQHRLKYLQSWVIVMGVVEKGKWKYFCT